MRVLVDRTPLGGGTVDVALRIGWLARMVRLGSPVGGEVVTLEELAGRLDTNMARLHRLETGQIRSGVLLEGYERVLGRPPGSLRATVDLCCRSFPDAPLDRDPGMAFSTVRELGRATDRVYAAQPTAAEWYAWARGLAQPGNVGFPERDARHLVGRLIDQLGISMGSAYPARYEALALLTASSYADVVLDAAHAHVADPHMQVIFDLASVVGERVSERAIGWALDLLHDPREHAVIGAVLCLETMAPHDRDRRMWHVVAEPLIRLLEETRGEGAIWWWLSHLIRTAPVDVFLERGLRPSIPLAPRERMDSRDQSVANVNWVAAQGISRRACAEVGVVEQPMLSRLVFDMLFGPHESHGFCSMVMMFALPWLWSPTLREIATVAGRHSDPAVRARASRRLVGSAHLIEDPGVADLMQGGPEERARGYKVLAGSRLPLDGDDVWESAHAGHAELRRSAVLAAAMAEHPVMARLRESEDPAVAGAATWWLGRGGTLTV